MNNMLGERDLNPLGFINGTFIDYPHFCPTIIMKNNKQVYALGMEEVIE